MPTIHNAPTLGAGRTTIDPIAPSNSNSADTHSNAELPTYYYLRNFIELVDTVEAQYGDLLLPTEQDFISSFRALDHPAQCLYVRLISRRGPLFRAEKLVYDEIGPSEGPLKALCDCGLASNAKNSCTVEQLGKVFTAAELEHRFNHLLDCSKNARKSQLLDALQQLSLSSGQLGELICDGHGDGDGAALVHVCGSDTVALLQLLFFGNTRQSLTDFVLSDLGLANYFPYRLDRKGRLFESRTAIDEYIACDLLSERYFALMDSADSDGLRVLGAEMLEQQIFFVASQRRWAKTGNRLARVLERNGELTLALALYQRTEMHPSRERTVRILESKKDWHGVVTLCRKIRDDPWCEAEDEAAQRIHVRAARALNTALATRKKDCFDEFRLSLPNEDIRVEQSVANALKSQWSSVHYLENKLMNTLFGLAFWEQIFLGVAGVFHNPFQSIPADMYDGHFLARRKSQIEARMAELAEVDLRKTLNRSRALYEGYQCRWVDWYTVSADVQDRALSVIPAEHLLAVWRRQLFDPRENRNGFPDLIAFGERPGDYCMIEVKAPGDRLQSNQKRWLRYFANNKIPARVAWVDWCDE